MLYIIFSLTYVEILLPHIVLDKVELRTESNASCFFKPGNTTQLPRETTQSIGRYRILLQQLDRCRQAV
jgi:hypothetical protein